MKIWIVSDGIEGHKNQSLAISQVVGEILNSDCSVEIINIKIPGNLSRVFLYFLIWLFNKLNFSPVGFSKFILKYFYGFNCEDKGKLGDFRLIINTGGKLIHAAVFMRFCFGFPLIQIGKLHKLSIENFLAVVLLNYQQVPKKKFPQHIMVDVAPSLSVKNGYIGSNNWLMCVGGQAGGICYTSEDWAKLAKFMNDCAKKHEICWSYTTSRRTPREAEDLLDFNLLTGYIKEKVIWGKGLHVSLKELMDKVDTVFVTADSVAMISEAISAQKKIVALVPKKYSPSIKEVAMLKSWANQGWMQLLSWSDFESFEGVFLDVDNFKDHRLVLKEGLRRRMKEGKLI